MDNLENNFIAAIIKSLDERLDRDLREDEIEAFSIPRSYIAYEMILDFLNDESKSQDEISNYAENVTNEYKTNANKS